jgi:hypothetical protein
MDARDFGYITKLTQKKTLGLCTMHRNKETVCLLHSQFLLSACVHLPTRVHCRNPKVPIAKSLLQPILLPADQIIMVTTNFLLLLKIIILSSFINFSSTAFGKLHLYQLVILLSRFMDLIIIRSGAAQFFIKMIIWGKQFSCDPHNFDGDENLVPEFDGLLQDAQNFKGIFPQEYESHVDLHAQIKFQYY